VTTIFVLKVKKKKVTIKSQALWYIPVIPVLGRLSLEDRELEASQSYNGETLGSKIQKRAISR
jgi:hypothetical protein